MPTYGQPGQSPYESDERHISIPEPPPYDSTEHEVSDIVSRVLDKHSADAVAEITEALAPRLRGEDDVDLSEFEDLLAALKLSAESLAKFLHTRRPNNGEGGEDDTQPAPMPTPIGDNTLVGAPGVAPYSSYDTGSGESLEPEPVDNDPAQIQQIVRSMTGRGHE